MNYLSEQLVRENEDYLTIPAIRRFAKNNNIRNLSECDRPELLNQLEEFALKSDENAKNLQNWFEDVLAEGIKTIFWLKCPNLKNQYDTNNKLGKYSDILINNSNNYIRDIDANQYITAYRINQMSSAIGNIVRISLVKKVSYLRNINESLQTVKLPLHVVLLLDHDVILVQFKSKSGIYNYAASKEELKDHITDDKLAHECIAYVRDCLKIDFCTSSFNKNTLYNLLQKYTTTPVQIKEQIQAMDDQIQEITNMICYEACKVDERNKADILWDITNIIEKYISINVEDKSIFTEDREAFPVKLISSDEEDSRVEQCACNVEPLQTKSIFFDNKKMMQKSKQCDGILLKYHRLNNTYFNNDIDVNIQAKSKYMVIKFTKYTMQEDIENVLNSIIASESRS